MDGTQVLDKRRHEGTSERTPHRNRLASQLGVCEFDPFDSALRTSQLEASIAHAPFFLSTGSWPNVASRAVLQRAKRGALADALRSVNDGSLRQNSHEPVANSPAKVPDIEVAAPEAVEVAVTDIAANSPEASSAESQTDVEMQSTWPDALHRLRELNILAGSGDEAAIAEIQTILNTNADIWRDLGNVEKNTEAALIEALAGSALAKECVRRSVADLRQSLIGSNSHPLVSLTAGRVIACWIFANFADRWAAWAIKNGGRASDLAKLLVAAEKRLAVALKSFELVTTLRSNRTISC